EGQFTDGSAADVVGGVERQFDEGGTGDHGGAGDFVVGQPGVGGQGDPTGEDRGVGTVGDGAEQRMISRGQSRGADVISTGVGFEPVAVSLEGIGRQGDMVAVVLVRGRVGGGAGREGVARGTKEGGQGAAVPTQRRDAAGGNVGAVNGFLHAGSQDGVGAGLDKQVVAVRQQ